MDNDTKTIVFNGTCSANDVLTLVSNRISSPFTIEDLSFHFALNTNRTLELKPFISSDDNAPSSGEPSGFNFLHEYGQSSKVVGDDEPKFFRHNYTVREAGSYLKIYANNTDAFDHTVDVHITIRIHERQD